MQSNKGQKKNQRIGKAGVAVAVVLIFTSTFSGDIQSFLEESTAKHEAQGIEIQPVQPPLEKVESVRVESAGVPSIRSSEPLPVSTPTQEPTDIVSVAPVESEKVDAVGAPELKERVKKMAVKPQVSAPKPVSAPRPVAQAPVIRKSPPQVVYQADLPPVPAFTASPSVAEKPLKFNAPAKAVRAMPRTKQTPEFALPANTAESQLVPTAPEGVYSLNTAPTSVRQQTDRPMPSIKTQAGEKAVLSMPDGTTRVVAIGDTVPGFGVVNKLTKNEVIFGANK